MSTEQSERVWPVVKGPARVWKTLQDFVQTLQDFQRLCQVQKGPARVLRLCRIFKDSGGCQAYHGCFGLFTRWSGERHFRAYHHHCHHHPCLHCIAVHLLCLLQTYFDTEPFPGKKPVKASTRPVV